MQLHANCIAVTKDRALLLMGPSGSGKSQMSLELMAYGAQLVADDQTLLDVDQGQLIARSAPAITGLIEARGLGILNADALECARVIAAVDMTQEDEHRLPQPRELDLCGVKLPLLYKTTAPALLQFLKSGRHA